MNSVTLAFTSGFLMNELVSFLRLGLGFSLETTPGNLHAAREP